MRAAVLLSLLGVSGGSAQDDTDGDLLSDDDENNLYFTDPFEPDSDWDGDWDGDEVANGTDPNDPMSNSGSGGSGGGTDTDGDGLSDEDENNLFGTNPYDTDTDLDGFEDGEEVDEGTDPNDPDSFPGSGGSSGSGGGSGGSGGGGSGGGGGGSSGDADNDGMTDAWEIAQGLNPNDPTDADRDFDYDRISHLEEFLNGTDANTDWAFVEIPEGVPLHARNSLNDLGQLAKVVIENDAGGAPSGFRIRTWNRATGWTDSHPIGDHDGYAPTEVRQNVFGMVAAVFQKYDSVAERWRGEIRVVNADGGAPVAVGHDQDWGIIDRLAITNSGFVVARFQDFAGGSTPTSQVLRWRDGIGRILEGSTLYPEGVNERGEIIETGEGVFRGGDWEWLGSSPLGINDRGEVWVADPNGTGAGRWSLTAGYATGYHFNDRADSVAALSPGFESQLENFGNFFDKPASAAEDPLDPVAFVDRNGNERVLTDPVSDAPLAYRRLPIISDINDLGDLGGWYLGHESDSELWFDDEAGGAASVPEPEGFLWRGGSYSLLGGVDQGSRFHALSNAGQVLVSSLRVESVDVQENLGDVDGDGVDDFQTVPRDALLTRWGMFVPQNDSDGDGLPDGWEAKYPSANQPDEDSDGDGLTNFLEYALMSDPVDDDSDDDEIPDDWEVRNGLDPKGGDDAGEDFDGDGLSNREEFEYRTSPVSRDTDGDGRSDGEEIFRGTDPTSDEDEPSNIDWTVLQGGWRLEVQGGEAVWASEGLDLITGEVIPEQYSLLQYPDSLSGSFGSMSAAQAALTGVATTGFWIPVDPAVWDWWNVANDYLGANNLEVPNPNAVRITSTGTEAVASAGNIRARLAWNQPAAAGKTAPDLWRQYLYVEEQHFPEGGGWFAANVEVVPLSVRDSVYDIAVLELSLSTDPAQDTRKSLLLLDFADEEPNSGLDDVTEPRWLMVPQAGENRVYAVTGADSEMPIEFRSSIPDTSYSTPIPARVTSQVELLTIAGGSVLGNQENIIAGIPQPDDLGPVNFADEPVLNIGVYEHRVVRIAIHPITYVNSTTGETLVPVIDLDAEEIETFLNRVYLDQANVEFEVTITDGAEVDWDIGGEYEGADAFSPDEASPESTGTKNLTGNGKFDIFSSDDFSAEETAVISAVAANGQNPDEYVFNVYLVREPEKDMVIHRLHDDGRIFTGGGGTHGFAGVERGTIWIHDYESTSSADFIVNWLGIEFGWFPAHEIGHQLIGEVHSQDYWQKHAGKNKFPDPELGLMTRFGNYQPAKHPTKLIKYEWDQIHKKLEETLQ